MLQSGGDLSRKDVTKWWRPVAEKPLYIATFCIFSDIKWKLNILVII